MSENPENSETRGVKRKKKRSANQMAKKFARRRDPGHGSELDTESYQYMVRILELLRTEFPSMPDKLTFADNVYEQTIGNELHYAKNQVGSRVLDSLLKYASLKVIQRLSEAFSSSLRPICSDRFASHVLEKMIETCAERGNKVQESVKKGEDSILIEEEDIRQYNEIALKLCRYVTNNFEEFARDTYANHVLRRGIFCLGGFFGDEQKGKKKRQVSQEFNDLLIASANRLMNWPQFREFGRDELTSGLLQTFLHSLKDNDETLTSLMIKKIISECFTKGEDGFSDIFETESSLRLLEAILECSSIKMYKKVFKKLFLGQLKELSMRKGANFTVQRLCDYCPTKEEFEPIFDEISGEFLAIIECGNTGVLASLAKSCLRLQVKQGPFVLALTKALGCEKKELENFGVALISRLVTFDQLESAKKGNRKIPIHLHGSLILQAILQFNKPIKIVNSIFSMKGEELAEIFGDPKGSRILDAFMESKFVGEKSRDKLGKLLRGSWVELACGIHGSRCLDKIWEYAKDNQKIQIMEELAAAGESLNSTKTGRIISEKLSVRLYGRSRKEWSEVQGKEEKTRKSFASIIGGKCAKE